MHAKSYLALWPCLLLTFGCVTHNYTRQNTELIRSYFEGWANHGDLVVADQLIATNLVLHNPPAVLHSLDEYKQTMPAFHKAFPDHRFTIEDQVAQGNKIAVRWTLRGTHLGEYQNRPPTGKSILVTGTSTFRIAGGKIQEIWVNMDRLAFMHQLGWITNAAEKK